MTTLSATPSANGENKSAKKELIVDKYHIIAMGWQICQDASPVIPVDIENVEALLQLLWLVYII